MCAAGELKLNCTVEDMAVCDSEQTHAHLPLHLHSLLRAMTVSRPSVNLKRATLLAYCQWVSDLSPSIMHAISRYFVQHKFRHLGQRNYEDYLSLCQRTSSWVLGFIFESVGYQPRNVHTITLIPNQARNVL